MASLVLLNLWFAVGSGSAMPSRGQIGRIDKDLERHRYNSPRPNASAKLAKQGPVSASNNGKAKESCGPSIRHLALITHEEIPDFLPARTTGFRLARLLSPIAAARRCNPVLVAGHRVRQQRAGEIEAW